MTDAIHDYITEHSPPIDAVQQELIERTSTVGDAARMQIGRDQGAFFTMLTQLMGATQAIEVGTFTGYSALCIARGLPPTGKLLTCDINEDWAQIARDSWRQAGLGDQIELRLGPALDTLRSLPMEATYDLAFIDADKPSYRDYYEELVPRVRPGGVILIDNVLLAGTVATSPDESGAKTMRAFNSYVSADRRVSAVILSIGDGVTLAQVAG